MTTLNEIDPDLQYFQTEECIIWNQSSLKNALNSNSDSLTLFHINIRSYNKNSDDLLVFLDSLNSKFSLIVLTETWFDNVDDWKGLNGYNAYHSIRSGRRGGGVTILVQSKLKSIFLSDFTFNLDEVEVCSIEVRFENIITRIVGIYRPPNQSVDSFNSTIIDRILNSGLFRCRTFLVGDFNIDIGNMNLPCVSDFVSIMRQNHFIPKISLPTRITESSHTIIDHVWVNELVYSLNGVFPVDISDHYPVIIIFPKLKHKIKASYPVSFRIHSDENYEKFEDSILELCNNFNEYNIFNVSVRCQIFCNKLFKIYDEAFPIKTKHISQSKLKNPWITDSLLLSIKRRHKLYAQTRVNPNLIPFYKKYRNIMTNLIRKAKKTYHENLFISHSNDGKKTWKCITEVLKGRRVNNNEFTINDNGLLLSDPISVSNSFNSHFTNSSHIFRDTNFSSDIDPLQFVNSIPDSFVFRYTNPNEVCIAASTFQNKSTHLMNIPNFIYKSIIGLISPTITGLFNSCFEESSFPNILKVSRVIPLFKKGDKKDMSNYRPISTLNFISKLFEKLLYNRLYSFLEEKSILSSSQYGFRKNISTSDALLDLTCNIHQSFNEKKYLLAVFLDVKKAFDSVDHSLLIRKMSMLGIRGNSLNLFKSYLNDRHQYTVINSAKSSMNKIEIGVPQGSVLGPLLFLIFINDLVNSSRKLKFILFADDTTIFLSHNNLDVLFNTMNQELENVHKWFSSNRLLLNLDKTNSILFSTKDIIHNHSLTIDNCVISEIDFVKFLGIFIDNKLLFTTHIKFIEDKISKSFGVLRKISSFLPSEVLKKIYYAIIHPFILYGLEIWGSASQSNLNKLRSIQRRSLKLFTSGNSSDNVNYPFVFSQILPLTFLHKFNILLKFFRYFILNNSLLNQNLPNFSNYNVSTRASVSFNFPIPFMRLSCTQRSFVYLGVSFWNSLPAHVQCSNNVSIFRSRLKFYLFQSL